MSRKGNASEGIGNDCLDSTGLTAQDAEATYWVGDWVYLEWQGGGGVV